MGELTPRESPHTKSSKQHPFEEIADFVQKVSSSNPDVNAAWDCLDSARTAGTVGSYGGSDGTADSIEILESLRHNLDAAEDREEILMTSPVDKDLRDLDEFEERLLNMRQRGAQNKPDRERVIQFRPGDRAGIDTRQPFNRHHAKDPVLPSPVQRAKQPATHLPSTGQPKLNSAQDRFDALLSKKNQSSLPGTHV